MIRFRPFTNADPPALAEIWRSRALERGLQQPISAMLLAEVVFGKTYFDNQGLILALDDDQPVGFVHAGFGPNESGSWLSHEQGIISMIMVRKAYRRAGSGRIARPRLSST